MANWLFSKAFQAYDRANQTLRMHWINRPHRAIGRSTSIAPNVKEFALAPRFDNQIFLNSAEQTQMAYETIIVEMPKASH
jgi:hypothetical protein